MTEIPPWRPRRRITGMSAVLLPYADDGTIAWDAFASGVARTAAAGLVPAVNVPAYRHDAALVWFQRGWAPSPRVHPDSPTRASGESDVLAALLDRLDTTVAEVAG